MRSLFLTLVCAALFLITVVESTSAATLTFRPCIRVNGNTPTPSGTPGDPDEFYKCQGRSVTLSAVNCGSTIINPLLFTYSWVNTSNMAFVYTNSTHTTSEVGLWILTIEYYDSGLGAYVTEKDSLNLFDYPVTPFSINNGDALLSHCPYDSITFNATANNQINPTSYNWRLNNTATIDLTTPIVHSGSAVYKTVLSTPRYVVATAEDINGCQVVDNIFAPLLGSPPDPNLGPDRNKCPEQSVTLTATPGYIYYWNGSATAGTNTFVAASPGKYWVTMQSGLFPCLRADTVYVSDYSSPTVNIGSDTSLCFEEDGPLFAAATGSGTLSYAWSPAAYFTTATNIQNPIVNLTSQGLGTFTVSVVVTDGNSCTVNASKDITHLGQGSNPYMFVTVPPIDICENTTKAFNTSVTALYPTTFSYQWTPATHLSSGTIQSPVVDLTGEPLNTPVAYTLRVTDNKGCYQDVATSATLVPALVASVPFSDTSVCINTPVTLGSSAAGGTAPFTYSWTPTAGLDDATSATPTSVTSVNRLYSVVISDSKGCSDSKTVQVRAINVVVILSASKDTVGYDTAPIVLDPYVNSSSYTYTWIDKGTGSTIGTDKVLSVTTPGYYKVIALHPLSQCSNTDSINVRILEGNPKMIYVPNVVNPSSDNPENNVVKVYGIAIQEDDFFFRIYNKWGEVIYETKSFEEANQKGWNGAYKGTGVDQNLSVYTYSLHGKYFNGEEFDKTGSITLMR